MKMNILSQHITQTLEPTLTTWILVISGLLIYVPVIYGQILLLMHPHSQTTKDFVIGKGENWRDRTHFRSSYGFAWADLIFFLPLLIAGSCGVMLAQVWGYALWAAAAAIAVDANIVLWFSEREYVYPTWGPLAYYTFYWGFFVYWGLVAMVYAVLRLASVTF
jgi:hypothetical protein